MTIAIAALDLDISTALRLTLPVIVFTGIAIIGTLASPLLLAFKRPRWRGPLATYAAALIAYEGSRVVGAPWDRPRPFTAMHVAPLFPHSADPSFPSPTVAFVAAIACAGWLAWPALGRALALATVLTAFGCVYSDVHWASDVVVGAMLGVIAGYVCWMATGFAGRIGVRNVA